MNEMNEKKEKKTKKTSKEPTFSLKDRKMNLMARIDQDTSRLLDALVSLNLAPSRSAAAAYLMNEAIKNDQEKYLKILESFDKIESAIEEAQKSFYKSKDKNKEENNHND